MAGSFKHCLTEEGTYRGVGLLDHMGDAEEAIEMMVFMLKHLETDARLKEAQEYYYQCARGEKPWPDFMKPGIDSA